MNVQGALKGQYHATLAMLKDAIEKCPENLWAGGDYPVPFWRVAYHALFFTHMYLQKDVKSFHPWAKHRDEQECLGRLPWPPHREAKKGEPYTRAEILEYWEFCETMVDPAVDGMDLDAPECGFPWYQLPKLDHQINNIRHLQHHAALLSGRLRQTAGTDIPWKGFA
jgi:hypothetical protein